MPDDTHRMPASHDDGDLQLRAALRALPLLAPPTSALSSVLAAHAARRDVLPAARRRPQPLAWAAGLCAVALGLILLRSFDGSALIAEHAAPSKLDALMRQSAQWEQALRQFESQSVPTDAGTALASAELEDLIGLTDLQLGATENQDQAESLWARRVELMSRLAELRTQSAWQRANPDQNAMLLSASYPIN